MSSFPKKLLKKSYFGVIFNYVRLEMEGRDISREEWIMCFPKRIVLGLCFPITGRFLMYLMKRVFCLGVCLSACSSTIMVKVPPRFSVNKGQTIGIVQFITEGENAGDYNLTRQFMESLQEGQPGIAIIELGQSAEVLKSVGKTKWNNAAVLAVGKKFEVDSLITGRLQLKKAQPNLDVNLDKGFTLNSFKAQVRVDGTLEATMFNTSRGATIWTGSSARWINIANLKGSGMGSGSINLPDTKRQYEKLVYDMVREATSDFRPGWEKQPKK